jgi:hypothetical protein
VAQRSRTKTGGRGRARASGRGPQPIDRLHDSIEAAQTALKELRSEMSRGSRALLKDVDSTLRDARKNVRSVRNRVAKDLEQAQQRATGRKPAGAKRATTTRSTARKTPARKSTAPKSSARKTTAGRSAARKRAAK